MNKNLINELVNCFKTESEKYSNELEGVVNYKCEEFFKRNNPEKGYHSVDAAIIFKGFTLKLEYKINISMLIPKSTVEMRFLFENGKLPVEYSIYDLFNIIDKKNFKCYTFGYVTDETTMQEVLKYLIETFKEYREKVEKLSVNLDKINMLENDVKEKINVLLKEKIFETRNVVYLMRMLELYYVVDTSRFTMEAFMLYLDGKIKNAISKYSKEKKNLTKYEIRLLEYLKENEPEEKPILENLNTFARAQKLKNTKKYILPKFLTWLVVMPVWCVVYDLIFYITLQVLTKDAIYVACANAFHIFLPAAITATISSYFLKNVMYKIFFRKNLKEILALEEIEKSNKLENLMSKALQFVIAFGIVFSILLANTNISFYNDGFKNNLDFWDIEGEFISYSDVKCVYKIKDISNNFTSIVNDPACVIVLNNGKQINLNYNIEALEIEKNIIPIFKNNNIQIKEVDSENSIEKYNEIYDEIE